MLKQKIRKIVATVLLGSSVLMMVPASSIAQTVSEPIIQQDTEISPRLSYIVEAVADLDIANNVATVDCWVKGRYGDATKAKVIAELQVKNGSSWVPVAIWTDTQNDFMASVYETKSVVEGHTYRVKVTATVWEGSQSEEVIFFTDEKP